eukprot:g6131.t1
MEPLKAVAEQQHQLEPRLPRQLLIGRTFTHRHRHRHHRLQWPLIRALAAALVYLGTATGAVPVPAAASTAPTRVRLNGNEQKQKQHHDQQHGGGGVRQQPGRSGWSGWHRGSSSSSSRDGGGGARAEGGESKTQRVSPFAVSFGGKRTPSAVEAAEAALALAGAGARRRGVVAFLPGVSGAGAWRGQRQPRHRTSYPSTPLGALRRKGKQGVAAAQQQPRRGQGPARARPATAARRALKDDGEAGGSAGGAGRSAKLPLRRRQRSGTGKDPGDWRPSLYMREGVFQALPYPVRITVMGGGNFGLALSLVLARNEIPTTLLVRTDSVAEHVNEHHEHPSYLKGITLPPHIVATADPKEALSDATFIIHAVPVQYTRKFLENVVQHMPAGTPILSVSKGIETSSLMLMNDILKDMCGAERSYAFLSGPSFAREIAMNQATAVVIASDDSCLANDMAKLLSSPTFRCFTSKDVIGVEVGGAVKNVIALAAGMCEGLGLGTNAMAGLVTRGCGEMRRLAIILGGKSHTLSGLSGVGDTFGTCFGPLSRNRNFGIRLGKGESMEEILASSTEVAEGVDTALALADLIRKTDKSYRIDLKYAIIFGVAEILKGTRSPKEGLEDLMTMPLKAEMYDS